MEELSKLMEMSYGELVDYLRDKYGEICSRLKVEQCYNERFGLWYEHKDRTTSRTDEGLISHTIHTDLKPLKLPKNASRNKYKIYCDAIEHFLLRVKIVEERLKVEKTELYGLGLTGAISNCAIINGYYEELPTDGWRANVAYKIYHRYDEYLVVLRYLKELVENSQLIERCPSPQLAVNWDGKVIDRVYTDIYKN